ncbi:MAG: 4Fe-4S dicluster domain-containing protein [Acidobacteria bacterium]|nr:4Fe-4S dicluster domain-containing protein [Acidobacteriota bacterium]
MQRREFLKLMGIVSGGAVLSSCGEDPHKKLISHVVPREGEVPGMAALYPSTCTECGAGCGIWVRVRERNPFKLEGMPGHPINDGALCIRGQASLSRLLHPDRITAPRRRTNTGDYQDVSWEQAMADVEQALSESGGRQVYLAGRTTGSLAALIDEFCRTRSFDRAPEVERFNHEAIRFAGDALFGRKSVPQYHLAEADVLVSLGADLLETFVSPVNFARQFAAALEKEQRWYHLEPHFSLTGNRASRRLVIRPDSEPYLLAWLLRAVPARRDLPAAVAAAVPAVTAEAAARQTGLPVTVIEELRDALRASSNPLLLAGGVALAGNNGRLTAVLAALLQWSLDMVGRTVDYERHENYETVGGAADFAGLVDALSDKQIGVLLISRLYHLDHVPSLRDALCGARFRVGLTDFMYPPYDGCDVILPLSHSLESWDDVEPRHGVISLIKPVFRPLHDTLSEGDILLQMMNNGLNYRTYLARRWGTIGRELLDQGWVIRDTEETTPTLQAGAPPPVITIQEPPADKTLVVVPSLRTFDGRSRVLTLLHEIPDPIATITYGNWVTLSVADADTLGITDGQELDIRTSGAGLRLPVKTHPQLAAGRVMVHTDQLDGLALPRDASSGEPLGILPIDSWQATGTRIDVPILSGSFTGAVGRGILPHDKPHHGPAHGGDDHATEHPPATLYPPKEYSRYRWALAIDLDRCIGCSACVAACYIENNVAIVGPDEHRIGREMAWLRIEPHLSRDGRMFFIPVMCQHCENAPCEAVCPVYATYHGSEGLNQQVYNRCVGTRYCANNCPYKVRRFNWFDHEWPSPLNLMLNPDVSVRPKGVMEKCTFCIQRIRQGKDHAKDQGRQVKDGEFTTACAQSCPTGAITFGNLLDRSSRIYALAQSPRAYRLLEGIGTEPAVYYLSKKRENA